MISVLDTEPGDLKGEARVTSPNRNVCEPPSSVRTALRLTIELPPGETRSVTFSCGTAGIVDSTSATETTLRGFEESHDPRWFPICDWFRSCAESTPCDEVMLTSISDAGGFSGASPQG